MARPLEPGQGRQRDLSGGTYHTTTWYVFEARLGILTSHVDLITRAFGSTQSSRNDTAGPSTHGFFLEHLCFLSPASKAAPPLPAFGYPPQHAAAVTANARPCHEGFGHLVRVVMLPRQRPFGRGRPSSSIRKVRDVWKPWTLLSVLVNLGFQLQT